MFNRKTVDQKTFSPGENADSAQLKVGTEENQHASRFHAERRWFRLLADLCAYTPARTTTI
jgi:hypothetical protein